MLFGFLESYGENPLQKIKVFKYEPSVKKTIIFIHGGAWRDPKNTYDDFQDMVNQLEKKGLLSNFIGINYRLSPAFKHPVHLIDILLSFRYISQKYSSDEYQLVGHSVGATLILQLLNYETIVRLGINELLKSHSESKTLIPTESELEELFASVANMPLTKLYLIDGIFDNVKLIEEYGAPYKSFIDDAFVSSKHFTDASQLSSKRLNSTPFLYKNLFLIILQSSEDELLSQNQSQQLVSFLERRNVKYSYFVQPWGKHEEVYINENLSQKILDTQ